MTDEQNLGNADNAVAGNTAKQSENIQTVTNTANSSQTTNSDAEKQKSTVFTRDQLAVASNNAKQAGIEQGKKEALKELEERLKSGQTQNAQTPQEQPQPQVQEQPQAQSQQAAQNNVAQPNIPQNLNQEDVNKMLETAMQQRAQQMEYEKICGEIDKKMQLAEANAEKYPNLKENIASLGFSNDPNVYLKDDLADAKVALVLWSNELPNTADVLNELGKNPSRYLSILDTAKRLGQPAAAKAMLTELSNSLAQNETASQKQFPAEPLGQVKPTTIGRENGTFTAATARNLPSLKA
jgi:hypothetical protein